MAIDIVGLIVQVAFMVYLPFMILRAAKLGNWKALSHPDRTRWLVLTICAGEIMAFGFVLLFTMTFFLPRFLPRDQLIQLPLAVRALGLIVAFVGGVGVLWAGMKSKW